MKATWSQRQALAREKRRRAAEEKNEERLLEDLTQGYEALGVPGCYQAARKRGSD